MAGAASSPAGVLSIHPQTDGLRQPEPLANGKLRCPRCHAARLPADFQRGDEHFRNCVYCRTAKSRKKAALIAQAEELGIPLSLHNPSPLKTPQGSGWLDQAEHDLFPNIPYHKLTRDQRHDAVCLARHRARFEQSAADASRARELLILLDRRKRQADRDAEEPWRSRGVA